MADATPYPIPREARQTDILVGNGGTVYGPFAFKIFDLADVDVQACADGEDVFSAVAVTVSKVSGLPLDNFTVTFPTSVPASTRFVVRSARVAERSAGVKSGSRMDPDAMEKEFSKVATGLQELRRDFDRAARADFGAEPPVFGALEEGRAIIQSGGVLVAGPSADEIGAANENAQMALDAAEQAVALVGAAATAVQPRVISLLSVKEDRFGALGDNSGLTVAAWLPPSAGARYATLAELQADYTFVTSTADTIDLAAFSKAILYANALGIPLAIRLPAGFYTFNRGLPKITKYSPVVGDGPRCTVLFFAAGTYNAMAFGGVGVMRCANAGLFDLSIQFPDGMTGGHAFELDFCQDFTADNVLIDKAYRVAHVRQCGNTRIRINAQKTSGDYGIKAYGDASTRNGGVDKVDILNLEGTHITGTGDRPNGVYGEADLIWLDGYVHTVEVGGTHALEGGRGLRVTNTPALAKPLGPSFINGQISCENNKYENIRADYANQMHLPSCFAVGSATEHGIYLGPDASDCIITPKARGNYKAGVKIVGAKGVTIMAPEISNNSQGGAGIYSGIEAGNDGGTDGPVNVTIFGGLCGRSEEGNGIGYTEKQKFGVAAYAGHITVVGTGLSGNVVNDSYYNFPTSTIVRYGRYGYLRMPLYTYANNAAALAGGLTPDDFYKTATGEVRIVV